MHCQGLVFDLDGTLLDTLDDIVSAGNVALTACGYPPHQREAYRYFVGNGADTLMARALPEGELGRLGPEGLVRLSKAMRKAYAEQEDRATRPYEGIPELLKLLRERGLKSAVLSNKPHEATMRVVGRFLAEHPFDVVQGALPDAPLKPDPTLAFRVMEQLGLRPADIIYVGDSDVDMRTARAAGLYAVGAAWGFRTPEELRAAGADAVCATPHDVRTLIDSLC